MVSAHAYPTFELSDAVPLLAKTAAKERTAGAVSGNPLLSGNPLPYFNVSGGGSMQVHRSLDPRPNAVGSGVQTRQFVGLRSLGMLVVLRPHHSHPCLHPLQICWPQLLRRLLHLQLTELLMTSMLTYWNSDTVQYRNLIIWSQDLSGSDDFSWRRNFLWHRNTSNSRAVESSRLSWVTEQQPRRRV